MPEMSLEKRFDQSSEEIGLLFKDAFDSIRDGKSKGEIDEHLSYLVENQLDINAVDNENGGSTLFIEAAKKNNIHVCKTLLGLGADFNKRDNEGKAPIHYAAEGGFTTFIFELLNKMADVNTPDKEGKYPVHYAAEKGHLDALTFILIARNHKSHWLNKQYQTALHVAAINGHIALIPDLVKLYGVDSQDGNGWTALHHAAANGHFRVVASLVSEHKADMFIQTRSNPSYTALELANNNSHNIVVNFLKTACVDGTLMVSNAISYQYNLNVFRGIFDKYVEKYLEQLRGVPLDVAKRDNSTISSIAFDREAKELKGDDRKLLISAKNGFEREVSRCLDTKEDVNLDFMVELGKSFTLGFLLICAKKEYPYMLSKNFTEGEFVRRVVESDQFKSWFPEKPIAPVVPAVSHVALASSSREIDTSDIF